jgi:hypothetical protein
MRATATATKPFIVHADARLFKGKKKLSLTGQAVYMLMRSLADGSTGELAINGQALSSRTICEQGGFSNWTWWKYRKELLAAGLMHEQRERVSIYDHKAGRMRVVLGETHYFVHRQAEMPKTVKKPMILLDSGLPSLGEPRPQDIQIPKPLPPVGVAVVPFVASESTGLESSSSPHPPKPDDSHSRVESLKAKVLAKCQGPVEDVAIALDVIIDRAERSGSDINSAHYLEVSLDKFNFQGGQDREDLMNARRKRQTLPPGQKKQLQGQTGEQSRGSVAGTPHEPPKEAQT